MILTILNEFCCRTMALIADHEEYAGEHCKKLGLTIDQFYCACKHTSHPTKYENC